MIIILYLKDCEQDDCHHIIELSILGVLCVLLQK